MTTTQQQASVIDAPKTVDPTLVKILSWKRPYNSKGEIAFMGWLHSEIKAMGAEFRIGPAGNVIVQVLRKDGKKSNVLFSCHTDTVHWQDGEAQGITYDPSFGHIFLDKNNPNKGNCLGADDGAGVWLMLRMIADKKPGTYVFHRGEEKGGIGANAMLKEQKEWLQDFDLAIAFDRPGIHEVITHQGGVCCASDKFGDALAAALNKNGEFKYEKSIKGVFTDTKIYRGVIAECVNLGVGYYDQHGPDETLDYNHLIDLLDAVLSIDFDALPVDRDPTKADVYTPRNWQPSLPFQRSSGGMGSFGIDDADPLDDEFNSRFPPEKPKAPAAKPKKSPIDMTIVEELESMTSDDIYDLASTDSITSGDAIIELLADLRAAKARIETYRCLLGLTP